MRAPRLACCFSPAVTADGLEPGHRASLGARTSPLRQPAPPHGGLASPGVCPLSPGRLVSGLAFVLILLINDAGSWFPRTGLHRDAMCQGRNHPVLFVQHRYVWFSASECSQLFTSSPVKMFNKSNLQFKRTERREKTQFNFQVDQSICIRCLGL